MSGFQVNPGYLRGYGNLIQSDVLGVDQVRRYAETHCRNFDRISGLMEPLQWYATFLIDGWADSIFPSRRESLMATASQLDQAADSYQKADGVAASRLHSIDVEGTGVMAPRPPARPPDSMAEAAYGENVTLVLTSPPDEHLTKDAEERIKNLIGDFTDIVKQFTGFDILAEWVPILLGDWGALQRLAGAWDQIGKGFRLLAGDLERGLGILAAHWQDGAAGQFTAHMNDRIIGGLEVYAQFADLNRQGWEFCAKTYESEVANALWLAEYYGVRFKTVVKKVVKALKEVSLNPKTWVDLIDELKSIVEDFINFIDGTIKTCKLCIEQLIEMVQLGLSEAKTALMFFEWKAKGGR